MTNRDYLPHYRHAWALVIGIDSYQDPRLPPLSTGVKGARAVADTLQTHLNFHPGRILLLENEQATQRAIRRAFTDPLGRDDLVGPDDRVLVYFGGHGITYETAQGTIGCIAPYDIESSYVDTAIPMDELTRLANRLHAKHVLFLLDACFSGFAATRAINSGVERQLEDFLTRATRQVIAAGTQDQAVSDHWGPGGHSLFTGFLLDGLRGEAPSPGGVLRAFHLAGYLQDSVAQHSRSLQTPQYAALLGSEGGDFILQVSETSVLPRWLHAAIESEDTAERLVAVGRLRDLAESDPTTEPTVLAVLQELANDPDGLVRSTAQAALDTLAPTPERSSGTRTDLVKVDLRSEQEEESPVAAQPQAAPAARPQPAQRKGRSLMSWVLGGAGVAVLGIIALGTILLLTNLPGRIAGGISPPASPATDSPAAAPTDEQETPDTAEPLVQPTDTLADSPDTPTDLPAETPVRTPPPTETADPVLALAESGVNSNGEWPQHFESINGTAMALVPAGCFTMGRADGDDSETPTARICLEPYYLDVFEITNGAFATFLNEVGNQIEGGVEWYESADEDTRIHFSSGSWGVESGYSQHPVTEMSWFAAVAFCDLRNARLPSEAEWEYAVAGPDDLLYPWGDTFNDDPLYVHYEGNTSGDTRPVGDQIKGLSWVGAHDLIGNVWEWTASVDRPYPYTNDGSREPSTSTSLRILRGGSYDNLNAGLNATFRIGIEPTVSGTYYGFRCAMDFE